MPPFEKPLVKGRRVVACERRHRSRFSEIQRSRVICTKDSTTSGIDLARGSGFAFTVWLSVRSFMDEYEYRSMAVAIDDVVG